MLFPREELDLWRAAAAGSVGAFFSLALSVHGRTILPDLQRTANGLDALLRIVIGVIAAIVLVGLIRSGAVSLTFGSASLTNQQTAWAYVLLVGFLAGFSERLVADLLAQTAGAVALPPVDPQKPPSAIPVKPTNIAADPVVLPLIAVVPKPDRAANRSDDTDSSTVTEVPANDQPPGATDNTEPPERSP